jgi:hypothetical protein
MNEINTMILLMTIFVVASVIWLVLVYFVTVRVYEITEETLLNFWKYRINACQSGFAISC